MKYTADMATRYDRISAERGTVYAGQLMAKEQARAAQAETPAALRRRAEAAEAEEVRRREEQGVAQDMPEGPGAQEARGVTDDTPAGLWARLWRESSP